MPDWFASQRNGTLIMTAKTGIYSDPELVIVRNGIVDASVKRDT
jgi:hypothetical protein